MIFFFSGLPIAFWKYQTSFIAVSTASDPELQKRARVTPFGAIDTSRSASSITIGQERPAKVEL